LDLIYIHNGVNVFFTGEYNQIMQISYFFRLVLKISIKNINLMLFELIYVSENFTPSIHEIQS